MYVTHSRHDTGTVHILNLINVESFFVYQVTIHNRRSKLNQYTHGHVSDHELSHIFKGPEQLANGLIGIKDALMKTHLVENEFTRVFNCPKLLK